MDRKIGEVEEKWLVLVICDKFNRPFGQVIGQVGPLSFLFAVWVVVWTVITACIGTAMVISCNIDVETVF